MFTIYLLAVVAAVAAPPEATKSNGKFAQAIKKHCISDQQKNSSKHSLQSVCDCLITNLQANASEEELQIIVKKQSGKNVINDIRKVEGAQTLFPFYDAIIEDCRENPNYIFVEEEPPPELRGTQSLPATKKTNKQKHTR